MRDIYALRAAVDEALEAERAAYRAEQDAHRALIRARQTWREAGQALRDAIAAERFERANPPLFGAEPS